MANLILRQEALDDLTDIYLHTVKNWSEIQADRYYAMIKAACNDIAINSTIGRKYNKINSNILGFQSWQTYHLLSSNPI
ncbi:MAG: type II toxin-antitoxin system RelE/ParE family toxin [Saprospiraceae bacterium]